ncbi:HEPN domain-containing protein [Halobacteriovorax sp. ZH4_bin.1]|uniref:HEPN domain-containing protein n=1 Tax=unclassified Halobacteriovorax TaxID=2639665 RepID=UPI0037217B0B
MIYDKELDNFTSLGKIWLPDNRNNVLPALLKSTPEDGLTLEVAGSLTILKELSSYDEIHGKFIEFGDITLFNNLEISRKLPDVTHISSLSITSGHHLSDSFIIEGSTLALKMNSLKYWIGNFDKEDLIWEALYSENDKIRIISKNKNSDFIDEENLVLIDIPSNIKTFNDFYSFQLKILNLFKILFCSDTNFTLCSLSKTFVDVTKTVSTDVYTPRGMNTKEMNYHSQTLPLNFQDIKESLPNIFNNWIENYDNFISCFTGLNVTWSWDNIYSEAEILALVQSLESVTNLNDYKSLPFKRNDFKKIKEDLKKIILSNFDEDTSKVLNRNLRHLNTAPLSERINNLFEDFQPEEISKLIGPLNKVIIDLVSLRNKISHGSLYNSEKISFSWNNHSILHIYTKRAEVLLYISLLHHLGIEPEKIMRKLYRVYSKYDLDNKPLINN